MANVLTAVRVVLIVPFVLFTLRVDAWSAAIAALVLASAIVTDLLDGPLARRRGTATALSGLFDHTADCLFVTSGLAAAAARGAVPWLLPPLVALAFAQYVADSYWGHGGRRLRTSALGRWNGLLYFAPLVGDVLVRLGLGALAPVVTWLAWLLVASTLISMAERLRALRWARRTARGSPAAGRGVRPPR